jgi:hypothetical protein
MLPVSRYPDEGMFLYNLAFERTTDFVKFSLDALEYLAGGLFCHYSPSGP